MNDKRKDTHIPMITNDKKKRLAIVLCTMGAVSSLLTGCGKANTNVIAGMEAIEQRSYDDALMSFEEAIAAKEDLELAYRGQGMAYLGKTDYENAISSFETALSHAGMFATDKEVDINYYLATAQYKSGNKEEALKTLQAIANVKDKKPEVFFLLGTVQMETDAYEQAVENLNKALVFSDYEISMTIQIYQVFANNGHKEEGLSYLSSAVDNRLEAMSDYERGVIYYYTEDYENARNFLEKAKGGKENNAATIMMLGKTYQQIGNPNYAAGIYNVYIEDNGGSAEIYNQLGLCKLACGEYEAALNAFHAGQAMEDLQSLGQELAYNEIVAYEYLGEFKQAASLMKTYLSNYPDDEDAQREYEFLKTR